MLRWLERLRQERSLRALRAAALGGAALALIAGFMLFAYELAAARVPAHRAALEALVRAQTGLDLRFEELALQWGWYGPEAVFSRIELGEPGGAAVLLKAPALIVGFDAWRTLQSGALQAGRITLVSPDIDLAPPGGARQAGGPALAPHASLERLLARWRDGRIDIEGGSVRIADTGARAPNLALAIRRATFYRAGDQLSMQAYLLLPERLGASARLELVLHGRLENVKSLSGRVRFEGARLQWGAWRELGANAPQWARLMPAAGAADVSLTAEIAAGRVQSASGSMHAGGVEFATALNPNPLVLDRVRGDWRLERRGASWHGEIDGFEVGRAANGSAPNAHVEVDAAGATFRASASALPLASLAPFISWLAPLDAGGIELSGSAQDVTVEWDGERAPGARLRLAAKFSELALSSAQAFTLSGIDGQIAGDERAWAIDLRGAHAALAGTRPAQALTDLNIASHLLVTRSERGWRIGLDTLDIQHEHGRLHMSGSVSAASAGAAPLAQLQGELADADVSVLQGLLGDELIGRFGAAASRLKAGRIETARFALNARAFSGTATLRDAIVADVPGLDAEGIAARIDWSDSRVSAAVDEGRAGPLTLGPMQLQWRIDGKSPIQIAGHASGRLENTLSWVRAHEQLAAYIPTVETLAARGDALFDFDFALLPDERARLKRRTHAHVAISLMDASVVSGPGMPPLEGVRGALAFDGGHLQHSLLTARWLGGPVSLKVAERTERGDRVFVVKAQGLLDVRTLASLGTFADPSKLWGEAEWSGDFVLSGESARHAGEWQAHLDSTLTGITSALPEPLTKSAGVASALHIEIAGSSERAWVRCALADRLHSVFEISAAGDEGWRVERGSVRFGGTGPVALVAEPAVVLSGELARLEPSPYIATWNRVRRDVRLPSVSGGVFVSQLLAAGDVYPDAHLTVRRSAGDLDLTIEPAGNLRGGT